MLRGTHLSSQWKPCLKCLVQGLAPACTTVKSQLCAICPRSLLNDITLVAGNQTQSIYTKEIGKHCQSGLTPQRASCSHFPAQYHAHVRGGAHDAPSLSPLFPAAPCRCLGSSWPAAQCGWVHVFPPWLWTTLCSGAGGAFSRFRLCLLASPCPQCMLSSSLLTRT